MRDKGIFIVHNTKSGIGIVSLGNMDLTFVKKMRVFYGPVFSRTASTTKTLLFSGFSSRYKAKCRKSLMMN